MKLSDSEKLLVANARKGAFTSFIKGPIAEESASLGRDWGAERTIRGEVLANLLLGTPDVSHPFRELNLIGAKISGTLDLQSSVINCRAGFIRCYFENPPRLDDAKTKSLAFAGSFVPGIRADRVHVDGACLIRNGFTASGELTFGGAYVTGDFDCSTASISNANGSALVLDGSVVRGNIFLRGTAISGEIRLVGTEVRGNLQFNGATLSNAGHETLMADRARIGGSVFLNDGFQSRGAISFHSADIGADLYCQDATLESDNPTGAFRGDGLKVVGAVFMSEGFSARGEVRLLKAVINNDLAFRAATLRNERGRALNAEGLVVRGALMADQLTAPPEGVVDLGLAQIHIIADDNTLWSASGGLELNGLTYDAFTSQSPISAKERMSWLKRQVHQTFTPQPYEQLIKVLRSMGHDRDARQIAIEKQKALRRSGQLGRWGTFRSWILGATIGHGYKPWFSLIWAAGLIFLGTVVFSICDRPEYDLFVPASVRIYEDPHWTGSAKFWLPREYPRFEPLIYAADLFLPIIDFHQKENWQPNESKPGGELLMYFGVVYEFLGWVFTTLAVLGFTGLVKKD